MKVPDITLVTIGSQCTSVTQAQRPIRPNLLARTDRYEQPAVVATRRALTWHVLPNLGS